MSSVKMSVLNLNDSTQKDFEVAANTFLDDLSTINNLELVVPTTEVEGTRGKASTWKGILITAINTGAFMGMYTVSQDFFSYYANAEVTLEFEDGSSVSFKEFNS